MRSGVRERHAEIVEAIMEWYEDNEPDSGGHKGLADRVTRIVDRQLEAAEVLIRSAWPYHAAQLEFIAKQHPDVLLLFHSATGHTIEDALTQAGTSAGSADS